MTPEQFQKQIEDKIKKLNTAKLIYPVATAVHDAVVNRIFEVGINGADVQIGKYSTDEAYFTRQQFNKKGAFKPQGKNSKKRKKENGEDRTSMYLPQGYKELRQIQGYESNFVNLSYSRDLRKDFSTKLAINNGVVVAKVNREINANKIQWLKEKYGIKTFEHTDEEKEFYQEEVAKKITEYLNS